MAKEDSARFDIPADMRAIAEKSVEQAKQAFDIFISAAQHAVNTAENQATSAQAGAKEMGELAMGFAERNIATSFEFAAKTDARQRSHGRNGAALRIREDPDRDTHRPGEGTEQTRGQNDWAKCPALICGPSDGLCCAGLVPGASAMVYLCSAIFLLQCIKNGSIGVGHSPPAPMMDVGASGGFRNSAGRLVEGAA